MLPEQSLEALLLNIFSLLLKLTERVIYFAMFVSVRNIATEKLILIKNSNNSQ